ncbi:MAG: metallophosphoesterase [Nanoarchaeota archaeon]|nr:metallophosphoesterase [Nanoarchaeota archaeon]
MKILVVGDPHGKILKKIPKNIDLILITGDLGKTGLARKMFFENIKRKQKGLDEIEETPGFIKKVWKEIYVSTIKVLRHFSKIAPVYFILGNVGTNTDAETKKEEEKLGIKLPRIRAGINKIKNAHLVRNQVRTINGLRIGFLEYFADVGWFRELGVKDAKRRSKSNKETAKVRRILRNFKKLDILVSHQPPYGILDKISGAYGAPKNWWGKHAGSKVVLDYIKKSQPKYVFCGHIHEGKGKKKVGKTIVINAGVSRDYFVVEV